MKIATTIAEFLDIRAGLSAPIGFVPTMGYLHEGHLSLVRAARKSCKSVIVSIFVNPTQFGPNEDLNSYPRDLQRDLDLLISEQVDLVLIPAPEEMYPKGFQTWINVEQITQTLEGAQRPGHFRGVCTIVSKLLQIVRPDIAFFGQKDAQQALVIQRMVADLNFGVKIEICPTVRELDGLAKSSRNVFLNPEQRSAAAVIYRSLINAQTAFRNGQTTGQDLRNIMLETLGTEKLAEVQYVSCSDPVALIEIDGMIVGQALLSLAVKFGNIRLIDNIFVGG